MNSFGKARRLLTKNDYARVFKRATKLITPYFIILYRENNLNKARLGLVLSKKFIRKAHDRNRIKRVVREIFRVKNVLPAVDLIILAKPGFDQIENNVITDLFNQICAKLTT